MTTTTIRLESGLKRRVAAAAARKGTSAHAFILDAIARTVEQTEFDEELDRIADARWERFLEDGKSIPLKDVRRYFDALGKARRPRRPTPKVFRR
jgi:predicted transcriptional regulator